MKCSHCSDDIDDVQHEDHPGLCCICFDLSLGFPLEQANEERAAEGKGPVKPWARRMEN